MKEDARPPLLVLTRMSPALRERLEERFTLHDAMDAAPLEEIEAVATDGHRGLSDAEMARVPRLRIVSCYGVGYDNIDAEAAARRGVVVTHTPDVLDDEVANTTIALLLAVTRRVVLYDRWVREGRWERDGAPPLTRGLRGRRVGLLGLGRIGTAIAEKLGVFGVEIGYHTRTPKDVAHRHFAELRALAEWSDVLIVIVPGTPATRGMVDRAVLDALGPDGTLVNVARGSVVDENALIDALENGRLGAAGLDVFADEPRVPERLRAMDRVVLLPHVGSATVETRDAMAALAASNVFDLLDHGTVRTPVPECADVVPTAGPNKRRATP